MVLQELVENIGVLSKAYANTYITNDITKMNTQDDIIYPVIGITQNSHQIDDYGDNITYSFNIFYVDRLLDDWESNDVEIQSDGIIILNSLLRQIKNELDVDIEDKRVTPFNQRFTDECAGVYLTCNIITPVIRECD